MTMIVDKLQAVRDRITTACVACGRDPAGVQLLAVSKTFGPDAVIAAISGGQRAFGENYIQEGVEKILALRQWQAMAPGLSDSGHAGPVTWHCIGPIQSNKTRLVAGHFDWVQSVDRLKIAQRLSEQRPADLPPLQVCLQVNIDGGPTKAGVRPEEAQALAMEVARLPRLQLRGLMSIPEPAIDFMAACALHQRARALFDQINRAGVLPQPLDTLSLGMTADLEAAIHAGSTMVRVGTAIFGGR
jgi:pyridoxal phosphate enzyme (YggS family)